MDMLDDVWPYLMTIKKKFENQFLNNFNNYSMLTLCSDYEKNCFL